MQSIQKVQKAIYTIINSQSTGELANINGVFHYIPQETDFPYVYIGEGNCEDISNFKNQIFSINININVFDKNKSNIKTMTLCDEIRILLIDIDNLSIDNHSVLDSKLTKCEVSLENDGETWKGEMVFKITVKKN